MMAATPYKVTGHLAKGIERLAEIRSQIKELEIEEAVVREEILRIIVDWPATAFPVRVGRYELRRQDRRGRLDTAAVERVIAENHCEAQVPQIVVVQSTEAATHLLQSIRTHEMPGPTRVALEQGWHEALAVRPNPDAELLEALMRDGRISVEQYQSCFKDARPMIPAVVVR